MNPDGTNQTRLTNNTAFDAWPSFSPDSQKITFTSLRDGNFEVYKMNADGTNQMRLTTDPGYDLLSTYSPDGQKIAFSSTRDGNSEIYVMATDGTGQTRLTNNSASDAYPTFSPDSSKIAFDSNRDGNDEIYSMNADGSGQTRLTNAAGVDSYPDWGGSVTDSTPPETTIDSGPSGPTSNPTPTFTFHSSEAGSSFECSIDTGTPSFGPCSGPGATHTPQAPLANGTYTFRVRATDPASNTDPTPDARSFTVDAQAPGIPGLTAISPASPANQNSPKVLGSAEAGSAVRIFSTSGCTGSPLATGSDDDFASPGVAVTVADNTTTAFRATATDAAGNRSSCSAPLSYTEDSAPPETTIDSGPSGSTSNTTPSFAFHSSEAGSSFACSIDTGTPSFGPCSGPVRPTLPRPRSPAAPTPSECGHGPGQQHRSHPRHPQLHGQPERRPEHHNHLLLEARRQRRDLLDERRRHQPDAADQQLRLRL